MVPHPRATLSFKCCLSQGFAISLSPPPPPHLACHGQNEGSTLAGIEIGDVVLQILKVVTQERLVLVNCFIDGKFLFYIEMQFHMSEQFLWFCSTKWQLILTIHFLASRDDLKEVFLILWSEACSTTGIAKILSGRLYVLMFGAKKGTHLSRWWW